MTSGLLSVDGASLEYRWTGTTSAKKSPIVLLHEGLGSVAMWRDFPEQLAEATLHPVFAYSRRGYGNSSPLEGARDPSYMHYEAEQVLPEVLKAAGIEKPILFGHSDGGSVALIYAGMFTNQISGLVLEAPHVFVEPLTVSSIEEAREAFLTTDLEQKLGRYHRDPRHAFWSWNDIWLDSRFLKWNIEFYLPWIECPLLLIQGEEDPYGTRAQLDSIVERTSQAEVLMLPRCGHSPHRDCRTEVLERTRQFLTRLAQRQAA